MVKMTGTFCSVPRVSLYDYYRNNFAIVEHKLEPILFILSKLSRDDDESSKGVYNLQFIDGLDR